MTTGERADLMADAPGRSPGDYTRCVDFGDSFVAPQPAKSPSFDHMFKNLFKKKAPAPSHYLTAQLNARVQPLDRGEIFEDPLMELLEREGLGAVEGGGTMMTDLGEIQSCDIEIGVKDISEATVGRVIAILEELGAPKGSRLSIDGEREVPFGVNEGLAVYLNGIDLPDEVYEQCDSNFVYSELNRLLEGEGKVFSHWGGPTETALYAYGPSFERMKARIAEFLESYPLCQKCRVEKIA